MPYWMGSCDRWVVAGYSLSEDSTDACSLISKEPGNVSLLRLLSGQENAGFDLETPRVSERGL